MTTTEQLVPPQRQASALDPDRLIRMRARRALLTQLELATKAGISRAEVSHLETGRRQPTVKTMKKLCKALDCLPGDLTGDPQDPASDGDPGADTAETLPSLTEGTDHAQPPERRDEG